MCEEENLLGETFFAIDGCKLSSNASKKWSGKTSYLERKKEKLEKKVKQLIEQQVEEDKGEDDEGKGGRSFGMSKREKRIERLQKRADRIKKFLKENGPISQLHQFKEVRRGET